MRCIGAFVLREAIHLVHGDSAGGTLSRLGLIVRPDPDMLALGPAALDPPDHARLRASFWRKEYRVGGWAQQPFHQLRLPRKGRVDLFVAR